MIKSSSTTSSNLKMKTIALSFGELVKQPSFWLAITLTVVAISLLVNLGLWQLNRAEQKRTIQDRLEQNQRQAALPLSAFIGQEGATLTGQQVLFNAQPLQGDYLLLDNQVFEGQVGYLALQLMQTEDGRYVLMERGFVAAGKSRTQLPHVVWLTERYQGEARLYQRSNNPLSEQLMAEKTQPMRIQNLNVAELSQKWQRPIEAYVVQPQSVDASWLYPQPWNPLPMSAGKHIGYAVQWFGMAIALTTLAVIWLGVALTSRAKAM